MEFVLRNPVIPELVVVFERLRSRIADSVKVAESAATLDDTSVPFAQPRALGIISLTLVEFIGLRVL